MDKETLRRAVEYADGWEYEIHAGQTSVSIRTGEGYRGTQGSKELLAALAAQLVRQVRKTHRVNTTNGHCYVFERVKLDHNLSASKAVVTVKGNDDTDNTLEACVQLLDKVKADE